MAKANAKVTRKPTARQRSPRKRAVRKTLPAQLNPFVLHIVHLRDRGWLPVIEKVMRRLQWRGNSSFDIFMFIYACICATSQGFDRFYNKIVKYYGAVIAAVFGRKKLPSDSSVFRFCEGASAEHVNEVGQELVIGSAVQVINATGPAATVKDTQGHGYHIWDFDGTIEGFRMRELVHSSEYPESERFPEELASFGFLGRKRGESAHVRMVLSHSGTGAFGDTWIYPGTVDFIDMAERSVKRLCLAAAQLNVSRDQFVLRFDGQGGNGRCLAIIMKENIHPLTRIARYELLSQPSFQRQLNQKQWEIVPLSEEGITRYATDAGEITLPTNAPDRPDIPPEIKVRLIVSRYRMGGEKKTVGHVIGDWVYEMFVTDLPAAGWPPAEIIHTYYERAGCENGISMQRKELKLGYLYTERLESLMMINNLALFLWNIEIDMGLKQLGHLPPEPQPEPRQIRIASDLPLPFPDVDASRTAPMPNVPSIAADAEHPVKSLLQALNLATNVKAAQGVTWLTDECCFICWRHQKLLFHGVKVCGSLFYAAFRTARSACGNCPEKAKCTSSAARKFAKDVYVPISAAQYRELLQAWKAPGRPVFGRCHHTPVTEPNPPGQYRRMPSSLFPRELRKSVEDLCDQFHVTVMIPRSDPSRVSWKIDDVYKKRRRRRLSWEQRFIRNHLSGGTTVTLHTVTDCDLTLLIPRGGPKRSLPYHLPVTTRFQIEESSPT